MANWRSSPLLYYSAGVCSAPLALLLLRRLSRGRSTSAKLTAPSTLPSAPLPEHKLDSAKRAMLNVQLAPQVTDTAMMLGDGCVWRDASDGRGGRYRRSCASLTASQAATRLRRIPRVRPADFYSSSVIGGQIAGIHSTP